LKKAEIVADQIEQTIVGQRWEPGDLFGSEVELIARYGVSRAVFREAVRLLEHHGLAEMRRGLHGGLFIRQPDPQPVAKAMPVYLDFEKVEPGQLEDARLAIEVFCVERVAARISEDEVAEVRAFLTAEAAQIASGQTQSLHDFHVLVARLTTNPALHLFVQTLADLTQRQNSVLERNRISLDDIHAAHAKIAEAIIARDGALARHRMMTHLEEVSQASTRRPPGRPAARREGRPALSGAERPAPRGEEHRAPRGEEHRALRGKAAGGRAALRTEPAQTAAEPVVG
jgi:DNA-binding FadR family transcriptional regulator